MPRKTASRQDLRRMNEAAENRAADEDGAKASPKRTRAKAKTTKKATSRAKVKAAPRRILMWAVYNGNMKEEARFSYGEREEADKKLKQLRDKSTKKLYFLQPIKIPLSDVVAEETSDTIDTDDEAAAKKKKKKPAEEEE